MIESDSINEIRLRTVVETAVDGVILMDSRGLVLMFNPACERLFGYDSGEVIGCNVKILMPEPLHSGHDEYLQELLLPGATVKSSVLAGK